MYIKYVVVIFIKVVKSTALKTELKEILDDNNICFLSSQVKLKCQNCPEAEYISIIAVCTD